MPMRKRESGAPFVDVVKRPEEHLTPEPTTTERLTRRIEGEHAATEAAGRSLRGEGGRATPSVLGPLAIAAVGLTLLGSSSKDKNPSTEPVASEPAKVELVHAEAPVTGVATIAATLPDIATKARKDALGIDEYTRAVGKDGFVGAGLTPTEESLQTAAQQREANNEGPRDIPPELLAAQVDYWGGAPASEEAIRTAQQQDRFNGQP